MAAADPAEAPLPPLWPRLLALTCVLALLAVLVSSDSVHARFVRVLEWLGGFIGGHPRLGLIAFVGLAALSAMLAFFSSALLVPAAIDAWGETLSALLLAELPYAIATVYLGAGVVERNSRLVLTVGAIVIVISALVFLALRRRLQRGEAT